MSRILVIPDLQVRANVSLGHLPCIGKYIVDMGDMDDFRDRVNQQYPSLERLRNLTFFPTGNKVLRRMK